MVMIEPPGSVPGSESALKIAPRLDQSYHGSGTGDGAQEGLFASCLLSLSALLSDEGCRSVPFSVFLSARPPNRMP